MSVLLFLLVPAALAASLCDIPPAIEELRRSLPSDRVLWWDALDERIRQQPEDFHLNRLYVDGSVYFRKPVRDRYARLAEKYPDNLNYQYLHARSLVGSNSKEALRLFQAILKKDPSYPWVHLPLMEIYRSDKMKDPAALQTSFEAITRACPERLEVYEFLRHVEDTELAARSARHLRGLLAKTQYPPDLALYSALWSAEFRVTPKADHDALRKRVSEDVRRLKSLGATHPSVQRAFYSAARLLGDKELEAEVKILDRLDDWSEWQKRNPRPSKSATHDQIQTWASALLQESARWKKQYPGDLLGYIERLNALARLDSSTPEEIARAADEALDFDRRHPDGSVFWPGPHRVAEAFVEHGIFLDRVPALIAETVQRMQDPEQIIEIDLHPNNITAGNRTALVTETIRAWSTLAQAYLKQGESTKVNEVHRQMEDYLTAKAPPSEEKDRRVLQEYSAAQQSFFWAKAKR